jgi:hypothetical protein
VLAYANWDVVVISLAGSVWRCGLPPLGWIKQHRLRRIQLNDDEHVGHRFQLVDGRG